MKELNKCTKQNKNNVLKKKKKKKKLDLDTIRTLTCDCPHIIRWASHKRCFYTSIYCNRHSLRCRHRSGSYKLSTLYRVARKTIRCCKKMHQHKILTVTVHWPLCRGTSGRTSGRYKAQLLNSTENTVHVRSWKTITGFLDKMDFCAMLFHLLPVWPVNKQIVGRFCPRFLQIEVRLAPNGNIFVKSKPYSTFCSRLYKKKGFRI